MPSDDFNHNPRCPFCGAEELHGTVLETFGGVPLTADGWDTTYANLQEAELDYLECHGCGKTVETHHFFHSDDDCDCKETEQDA